MNTPWAQRTPTEIKEMIQHLINSIPADLDHIALIDSLREVCSGLSFLDPVTANSIVRLKFKSRFNLTNDEIRDYRRLISEYRSGREPEVPGTETHNRSIVRYTTEFPKLIDIVEHDGKSAFLVMASGSVAVIDHLETDGSRLEPPPLEKIPFPLSSAESVVSCYEAYSMRTAEEIDGELYDDLLEYYQIGSELPHAGAYHALVGWTFHSYLIEQASYSPFMLFFGMPGRGKTRTGRAMINVGYHGMHIESLCAAHLIRITRDLHATIFVDVRDVSKKLASQHSGDIILLRYERGATVPRVNRPGQGPYFDMEFYPVFGPTILASNEPVDDILLGRSIQIQMIPSTKLFAPTTPQSGEKLRERLLAFRSRHMSDDLAKYSSPYNARFGDITAPVLQMVNLARPEYLPSLVEFLTKVEEQKNIEKLETLETRIVIAVQALAGNVRNGRLPVKAITDRINEGRDARSRIDASLIGRKLGALGFEKAKTGNGCIAILWDSEKVMGLAVEMGLPPDPSEPPSRDKSGAVDFLRKLRDS